MAKKTKATRRSRAKKEAASKKKTTAPEEAVIIAEGSDEPVAKASKVTPKKTPTKKPAAKKVEVPAEQPVMVEETKTLESIDALARPQRLRMLVSAGVLVAVLIAAVTIASLLGRTDNTAQNQQMPQTAQTPTDPDKLLESGGGVCTNGNTQTDPAQSAGPGTVGMMLQSVPSQQIQTPQGLGSSNDASTLQGASCF